MRREQTRRLTIGTAFLALLLLSGPVTSAAPPMPGKSPAAALKTRTSDDELASAGRAIEAGEYRKALETLTRIIDGNALDKQGLALAYHHRGIANQKLGLQSDAIDDYTRAIDLGSLPAAVAARAHYNRAISLAAAGNRLAAERDYTKAIDLAPDYAAAYHNRANLERDRNDFPTAIRDYGAAIEGLEGDKRKLPFFGRALAYEKSGNLAEAVADLNRALSIDPAYDPARSKLRELEPQLAAIPDAGKTGSVIKVASAGGWETTATRAGRSDMPAPLRREAPAAARQETAMLEQEPRDPIASSGRYRIQLGAFRKSESAAKAWADMTRRDTALAGLDHDIETADLGPRGTYYRLRAGAFKTASEARTRCADLAVKKIVCVVVER